MTTVSGINQRARMGSSTKASVLRAHRSAESSAMQGNFVRPSTVRFDLKFVTWLERNVAAIHKQQSNPCSARGHQAGLTGTDAGVDGVVRDLGNQRSGTEKNNLFLAAGMHELWGRIALAEKNYDSAIAELDQANQQDPANLLRLGQAYGAKGDAAKAKEYFARAAAFNSLPQLNYAFIRTKAQKMADGKKA